MTYLLEDLSDFLAASPTSWHAVREMGNRLASLDFTPLNPHETWGLEKGRKYFVIQDGSIAVFALSEKKPEKMAIIAAHTDSPALKIKPHPEKVKYNMKMLGVEVYGGPILSTWTNRDLALAGRVSVLQKNEAIEEHLVFFDDAPVIIPLLAPHLDRDSHKKGFEINPEEHLAPLVSLKNGEFTQNFLENLLKRQLSFHKLLDFDLFLVPLEEPRFIGPSGEMLASYRLDNLVSTHAGLTALGNLDTIPSKVLPFGIFWDHEEIGSSTQIGAASPFFTDTFMRVMQAYKMTEEEKIILKGKSLCLSIDVGHALNPLYEKKHDLENTPLLGEGIVVKYHAGMRYTTNGKNGAKISHFCDGLNLKSQKFAYRADNPAGSTVGPIFSTLLGIETADIGIPQLSMHATREIIACQDYLDLSHLLTHFLQKGL